MTVGADRARWATLLHGVARAALAGTPLMSDAPPSKRRDWIAGFRDELGVSRRVDRALLARVLGVDHGPAPEDATPDEALWWATDDPAIGTLVRPGKGPLLYEPGDDTPIEVRTESELCALHALWARQHAEAGVVARCLSAARWHIAEIQPDNATGTPWAVHVFVELACRERNAKARDAALFHAEGLVHTGSVTLGKPGLRAACLLLDAARWLDGAYDAETPS